MSRQSSVGTNILIMPSAKSYLQSIARIHSYNSQLNVMKTSLVMIKLPLVTYTIDVLTPVMYVITIGVLTGICGACCIYIVGSAVPDVPPSPFIRRTQRYITYFTIDYAKANNLSLS